MFSPSVIVMARGDGPSGGARGSSGGGRGAGRGSGSTKTSSPSSSKVPTSSPSSSKATPTVKADPASPSQGGCDTNRHPITPDTCHIIVTLSEPMNLRMHSMSTHSHFHTHSSNLFTYQNHLMTCSHHSLFFMHPQALASWQHCLWTIHHAMHRFMPLPKRTSRSYCRTQFSRASTTSLH